MIQFIKHEMLMSMRASTLLLQKPIPSSLYKTNISLDHILNRSNTVSDELEEWGVKE